MTKTDHDALAARIKAAQQAHDPKRSDVDKQAESTVNAGGLALRYGAEFGASVFVGLLMGLGIDTFFGTEPWGLLIMLGFGLAAGVLGVIRAYKQINADLAAEYGRIDEE
jgi:ATP synthase protein I